MEAPVDTYQSKACTCVYMSFNFFTPEQLSHIETTSSDPPAAGNRKLILELSEQVSSLTHELRVAQTTIKGLHSGLGTQPLTSDIGN